MVDLVDFNMHRPPILPVRMPGEKGVLIHVTVPTLGLIREVQDRLPEYMNLEQKGVAERIKESYDLAARLISSNLDGLTVTAEDLRDKYDCTRYDLMTFYRAYVSFLTELQNAKN